jgi:hypothetical protein
VVSRQLEHQLSRLKSKRVDEEASRWARLAPLTNLILPFTDHISPFACRIRDLEAALSARDESLREVRRERNTLLAAFRRLGIPLSSESIMETAAAAAAACKRDPSLTTTSKARDATNADAGPPVIPAAAHGYDQQKKAGGERRAGEPWSPSAFGADRVTQRRISRIEGTSVGGGVDGGPDKDDCFPAVVRRSSSESPTASSSSSSGSSIWEAAARDADLHTSVYTGHDSQRDMNSISLRLHAP